MLIGVVEDDPDQLDLLLLWIRGAGHEAVGMPTRQAAIDALKAQTFDLLLVDWMLPDGTGADLLAWIRGNIGWTLAVIIVTARDDEQTVCGALQAGADDFVTKPPKQMELLARIEAVARRVKPGGLPVLRMGAYEIDIPGHRLTVEGVAPTLTQKEFDLSVYLFQNPGKLLSRDHLLNRIWGLNTEVDTRTVDTHVSRLRKKLSLGGAKGWRLASVYGYGYRLERAEETAPAV